MRILIVFCHPHEGSNAAGLFECAKSALETHGHEIRVIDLYRDGFDPVIRREEWLDYFSEPAKNIEPLKSHVEALRWANGLILIYPTWMYGPPAMLKGWMERVLLPGVAFEVALEKNARIVGGLQNIKYFLTITTSGSPRWWLRIVRDPGRNMIMRAMRILFHPSCRMRWLQLYDMDHASEEDRAGFMRQVEREVSKI
ncbi:MAG: NAD(P)H-dependent oxidoreductase [Hyphomicrobiales bacterium]|nr:NAD(P)H-dependent oxidoreductase [Hyphomicrobiales bacterium]MCP4999440.1 NAD(P)H-dependent oxidoreductase [Hyphomicrobiales bacterium]